MCIIMAVSHSVMMLTRCASTRCDCSFWVAWSQMVRRPYHAEDQYVIQFPSSVRSLPTGLHCACRSWRNEY